MVCDFGKMIWEEGDIGMEGDRNLFLMGAVVVLMANGMTASATMKSGGGSASTEEMCILERSAIDLL